LRIGYCGTAGKRKLDRNDLLFISVVFWCLKQKKGFGARVASHFSFAEYHDSV